MKKLLILSLLILPVFVFSACGQVDTDSNISNDSGNELRDPVENGATEEENESSSGEMVSLKLGHALQVDHLVNEASNYFAELVAEKSEGTLDIQVFPAQQLGSEQEMLEQISVGAQDLGVIVGGAYGGIQPELEVLSNVYTFRDVEHLQKSLTSEVGKDLFNIILKEKNIRIIDPSWYYGTRHLTANEPIETPDDLHGKKIRVPELAVQVAGLTAMGAEATPVDFNELYMALSTGVVDGQENPATTAYTGAYYEVQDYFMLTGHIIANTMVSINEDIYQSLSSEHQQILEEAAAETGEHFSQVTLEEEEKVLAELEKKGMTIIEPDREAFKSAGKKVADQHKDVWGEFYDGIQKIE